MARSRLGSILGPCYRENCSDLAEHMFANMYVVECGEMNERMVCGNVYSVGYFVR